MQNVKLRRIGAPEGEGEQTVSLEHANNIFALQKLNPPKTWELADTDYKMDGNVIIPVDQDQE